MAALRAAVAHVPNQFGVVSVCARERGTDTAQFTVVIETGVFDESRFDEAVYGGPFPELFALDETPLGSGVLEYGESADLLEGVLRIVSSGSFPAPTLRSGMSDGHWRHLRDAMAFEAHCRHRRHVFLTDDKVFSGVNRPKLQDIGQTRILSLKELLGLSGSAVERMWLDATGGAEVAPTGSAIEGGIR
jgi:hypothetical protein